MCIHLSAKSSSYFAHIKIHTAKKGTWFTIKISYLHSSIHTLSLHLSLYFPISSYLLLSYTILFLTSSYIFHFTYLQTSHLNKTVHTISTIYIYTFIHLYIYTSIHLPPAVGSMPPPLIPTSPNIFYVFISYLPFLLSMSCSSIQSFLFLFLISLSLSLHSFLSIFPLLRSISSPRSLPSISSSLSPNSLNHSFVFAHLPT